MEPGRLVESPCPHCGHMDRRAFGETVSPRDELASYAFGWVGGHEDRVGRLTIGIGAGNEGGGTFHVELRAGEDGWVMTLVDEPFEDVPEGGPDLSADEARAHESLRFVWWVAEEALAQDRRAWWMEAWLRGTRSFATKPVVGRVRARPARRARGGRLATAVRHGRGRRAAGLPPPPRARP